MVESGTRKQFLYSYRLLEEDRERELPFFREFNI
jgi:hypothetical protein